MHFFNCGGYLSGGQWRIQGGRAAAPLSPYA